MTKAQLFARWQELHLEYANCEVEYDELTATLLALLVAERCKAVVQTTLDQALNSGNGSYRP